ncbi:hypothetical protein NH00_24500 [Enterobacter cancerogenus]|jgi:hypothetical protein|nr:hypothetical protein NH00_24500 [Enterobacter cancerogenus]
MITLSLVSASQRKLWFGVLPRTSDKPHRDCLSIKAVKFGTFRITAQSNTTGIFLLDPYTYRSLRLKELLKFFPLNKGGYEYLILRMAGG